MKANFKYEFLVSLIFIIPLFYQFAASISIIKTAIILLSFVLLWLDPKIKVKKINIFFILYLITIVVSSITNIGNLNYTITEFINGIIIFIIPIGLFYNIIQKEDINFTLSYNIQKTITFVSAIVLSYVLLNGSFTDYGTLGIRFSGGVISPSIIALYANLSIIFCLLNLKKQNRILIFPLTLSFLMLILTLSKNGIIIAVLALIYETVIKKKYILSLSIISVAIILLFIFIPYNNIFNFYLEYTDSGNLESLSGRTIIWETCQSLIDNKPWLGYGYNSAIVILPPITTRSYFLVEQAHNIYYESMLNIGIIGTVFLFIYILKVIVKCIINFPLIRNNSVLALFFFVVLIGLFRGYTEASFAQANNIIDVSVFFISILLLDYWISPKNKLIFIKDKNTSYANRVLS